MSVAHVLTRILSPDVARMEPEESAGDHPKGEQCGHKVFHTFPPLPESSHSGNEAAPAPGLAQTTLVAGIRYVIFDYSKADDFQLLWSFPQMGAEHIIIVWSRTAPDYKLAPINASDALSPLDWAAAYARHLHPAKMVVAQEGHDDIEAPMRVTAAAAKVWPKILVIDVDPDAHRNVSTLAHSRSLREDQLPWLTVLLLPSLQDILEWFAKPFTALDNHTETALTRFLREIRLNLTEPCSAGDYDRHAISNIVAPMVLLGGAAIETLHAAALFELMRACGLVNKTTVASTGNQAQGVKLVLCDDQAHHGWHQWLEALYGQGSVQTVADPEMLINELFRQFEKAKDPKTGQWPKDLRFSFQLPGGVKEENPILLLDLRLFSGQFQREVAVYKERLLPLVEHFTDKEGLAWNAFTFPAGSLAARAKQAVEKEALVPESEEHHEVITWLPRILALADMSLPIIIFSSTGRREIVKSLSSYQNIIIHFEKPRFFGAAQGSGVVAETEQRIKSAVVQAFWIANARGLVRRVEESPHSFLDAARKAFEGKTYFEIFHDESLSPGQAAFRVAALIAGYRSCEEADQVDCFLKSKKLRFYKLANETKSPLKKTLRDYKYDDQWSLDIAPKVSASLKQFDYGLIRMLALSGIAPPKDEVPLSITNPNGLDNVNTDLVKLLIEVLLVDIIPWLVTTSNYEIYFYGATRFKTIPILDPSTAQNAKLNYDKELKLKWGIDAGIDPRKSELVRDDDGKVSYKWSSVGWDGYYAAVADVLFQRQQSSHSAKLTDAIKCAVGVPIPYVHPPRPDLPYRHLHNIADRIASLSKLNGDSIIEQCEPFKGKAWGFRGRREPLLLTILNINRCLDNDEIAEAFCLYQGIQESGDIATDVVLFRLKKAMSRLPGETFDELVRMLPSPPRWMDVNRLRVINKNPSSGTKAKKRRKSHELSSGVTQAVKSSFPQSGQVLGQEKSSDARPTQGIFLSLNKLMFTGFVNIHEAISGLRRELEDRNMVVRNIHVLPLKKDSWRTEGVCVELENDTVGALLSSLGDSWFHASDGSFLYCERAGATPSEKREGKFTQRGV